MSYIGFMKKLPELPVDEEPPIRSTPSTRTLDVSVATSFENTYELTNSQNRGLLYTAEIRTRDRILTNTIAGTSTNDYLPVVSSHGMEHLVSDTVQHPRFQEEVEEPEEVADTKPKLSMSSMTSNAASNVDAPSVPSPQSELPPPSIFTPSYLQLSPQEPRSASKRDIYNHAMQLLSSLELHDHSSVLAALNTHYVIRRKRELPSFSSSSCSFSSGFQTQADLLSNTHQLASLPHSAALAQKFQELDPELDREIDGVDECTRANDQQQLAVEDGLRITKELSELRMARKRRAERELSAHMYYGRGADGKPVLPGGKGKRR
ncbi:hypothetical protein M430DRAFT_56449 [Amorphotheca resinae ATCC 22711]|uniref:Uncharacterized protein n=1 Tax=Amorphotheca resinae ATCC 22711 TaxID=857342 RepID=A0A2T3BBR6_AMORE|nr:hypothetical protein M430DRAFT_56449 [Amorphotheca resinae ATCC 22711]PSS25766.1 hypothetical protein M430DRAFT_56449 [Amorphotheca resinae ATCC 22711]